MNTPAAKINGLGSMQIGGEVRPFQVNSLNHQEMFTKTLGLDLDDYGKALANMADAGILSNVRTTVAFIWSALWAGSMRTTKKQPDFEYQDVLNWIEDADENDKEQLAEIQKPITLLSEMFEAKKNASQNK